MQIQHGMQVLKKQLVDLDGPGRVRAITKVVSDFYVPAKITHACAHLLSGICTRARHARTLEGAASMMGDEFAIAELLEEVVAGAEQVEAAAEQGVGKQALAEFMEAAQQVAKPVAIVPRPLKVLVDEIKTKFGGVIPFDRKDLRKELKVTLEEIKKQFNSSMLDQLKKAYGKRVVLNNGKKYDINLLIDHVLNFEFDIPKINALRGFELQLSGGHISGIWKSLEEFGLVEICNQKVLSNGCIEYSLQNVITGNKFKKTEFPVTWSHEKILKNAWQVFDVGVIGQGKKGKLVKCACVDGLDMSIVFKEFDKACNIVTILPYNEKLSI